ncbi:MAG: phage tail protein [bacterium]
MAKGINRRVTVDIINRIKGEEKIDALTMGFKRMGNTFNNVSRSIVKSALRQEESMKALGKRKRILTQTSQRLGLTVQEVSMAMRRLGYSFDKTGDMIDAAGRRVRNFQKDIGRTAAQMRPFRMELLSVMFAGMALQRAISGLMRKSMEWTGVWEILSTALGLLFLPTALKLLDWALVFLDWVSQQDESTKNLLGVFVLLAGGLGTLAMIFGQVGLALMGLGQLFPGLVSNIKATGGVIKWLGKSILTLPKTLISVGKSIITFFAGLSAPILAIVAIILAAIIGIYVGWKENLLNMRKVLGDLWDGVKDIFGGIFQFIKGILQVLVGIFTLNFEMIKKGIANIFLGLGKFLIGLWKTVVNAIIAVIFGLVIFGKKVVDMIFDFFRWLYDKLVGHSIIPDMVNEIIDWFLKLPKKIMQGFKNLASKIKDTLMDIIPDWMIDIFKKGISIGSGLFDAARGILGSFQTGGVVPQTGPYVLHKGETVVPTEQGNTNNIGATNNIVINANVSRDYDVRKMADKLNRYLVQDYNRLSNRK